MTSLQDVHSCSYPGLPRSRARDRQQIGPTTSADAYNALHCSGTQQNGRQDTRLAFTAAFDTYMGHEALADARRVGRALRRLGVHRRIVSQPRAKTGWDSLTDSEVTVVNLIAQGATNRSVAERLHVTPHTVKAHLHNAFAKLSINSRAQLTQLMAGPD